MANYMSKCGGYRMISFRRFLWLSAILLVFDSAWLSHGLAADIYVDKTLSGNITDGSYSIANRNSSGSDGNAYRTIQAAVDAMDGGDDIFIRGGTYAENVFIGKSKDGSSSDYSSIQSYPGEWAVVDGRHQKNYTLGHYDYGDLGGNDRHYWRFERLEITGGTDGSSRGWGLAMNGDHFIVRYCYFHDNIASSNSNNPGGIGGYCWRDSIIEYNWFTKNGSYSSSDNGGDILIFADYRYNSPGARFNEGSFAGYYMGRNVIRYNLFQSGVTAIRQKSYQDMTDGNYDLSNTYRSWGDKIHNNIFVGYSYAAIQAWQDFGQIYNNICDRGHILIRNSISGTAKAMRHVTVYNNTFIKAQLREGAGNQNSSWTSHVHWYNNIIDQFGRDSNGHPSLAIASKTLSSVAPDVSQSNVSSNYISRSTSSNGEHFSIGNGYFDYRRFTNAEFDAIVKSTNYSKSLSQSSATIFRGTSGAQAYKSLGSFSVSGSVTLANGGFGRDHPYLSGVTLPSYIGATNPNRDSGASWSPQSPDPHDSGWVDYVLSLKSTDTLKNSAAGDGGNGGNGATKPPTPGDFRYGI